MEISFYDKERHPVIRFLNFSLDLENVITFDIEVRITCFEINTIGKVLKPDLLLFGEKISQLNELKIADLKFSFSEGKQVISIKRDVFGHIQYDFSVCDESLENIFTGNFTSDLTFLPQLLSEINSLNNCNINTNRKKMDDSSQELLISFENPEKYEENWCDYQLSFVSPFALVKRNVTMSHDEINKASEDIQGFVKNNIPFSISPLGQMFYIDFNWENGKVLLSGEICDFSFPCNHLNFRMVGNKEQVPDIII